MCLFVCIMSVKDQFIIIDVVLIVNDGLMFNIKNLIDSLDKNTKCLQIRMFRIL